MIFPFLLILLCFGKAKKTQATTEGKQNNVSFFSPFFLQEMKLDQKEQSTLLKVSN
jgi:hypothetical protein